MESLQHVHFLDGVYIVAKSHGQDSQYRQNKQFQPVSCRKAPIEPKFALVHQSSPPPEYNNNSLYHPI